MLFEKKKTLEALDKFIEEINNLPKEITDKTIILIGPMGTGKSTISRIISDNVQNLDRISLDNKELLEPIYKNKSKFKNYKNFELMLVR